MHKLILFNMTWTTVNIKDMGFAILVSKTMCDKLSCPDFLRKILARARP